MLIALLYALNWIIWFIVIIIIILELLKVDYPYKNLINKELSKIQVSFNDTYKVFLLLLIPIVISFIISILTKLFR